MYFFSRRTYSPARKSFGLRVAALTRYVRMTGADPGAAPEFMACADWVASVAAAAGASREVLVFVHGFNTDQDEMLERQDKIVRGLETCGYEGAVVGYDWPSDGSVFAYGRDRGDAQRAAPHLITDGIFHLQRAGLTVHVLAHSMGSYLTLRGFAEVPGAWSVGHVAFVASDVSARFLGDGTWGTLALERRAARMTNYFSTRDEVLSVAGAILHDNDPRIGWIGLPDQTSARFADVYCNDQYVRHTAVQTLRSSHKWYFENAGFFSDLSQVLAGHAPGQITTRRTRDQGRQTLLTP